MQRLTLEHEGLSSWTASRQTGHASAWAVLRINLVSLWWQGPAVFSIMDFMWSLHRDLMGLSSTRIAECCPRNVSKMFAKDHRSMRDNCDFRFWILVYYRQYNRGNPGKKKRQSYALDRKTFTCCNTPQDKSLRNDLQFGCRCSWDVWSQGMTKERGRKQKWFFRTQRHHAQENKKIRMIRNPRISELVRTRSVWLTRCQHFVEEFWERAHAKI